MDTKNMQKRRGSKENKRLKRRNERCPFQKLTDDKFNQINLIKQGNINESTKRNYQNVDIETLKSMQQNQLSMNSSTIKKDHIIN